MKIQPLWPVCNLTALGNTSLSTVEFNLIFPRNDTYEAMPLMPVVFAVHNPEFASLLHPLIDYAVHPLHDPNTTAKYQPVKVNMTGHNTVYYAYDVATNLFNTEGIWELSWSIRTRYCSIHYDMEGNCAIDMRFRQDLKSIVFTTNEHGLKPDPITTSLEHGRDETQRFGFNIQETMDIPLDRTPEGLLSCAVVATPESSAHPCPPETQGEVKPTYYDHMMLGLSMPLLAIWVMTAQANEDSDGNTLILVLLMYPLVCFSLFAMSLYD
ncbi:hypothetical protein VFPPC_00104 [Pochonia chlamydosporia 170]|uniref:DUF7136 domain-containing protein n=1 Tax=Pochonia chlamydosporia 170 TaxID=1380566 RepID=A0A179G3J9_METCM|nr:hypothetical protein VFPPC_00104 [Pochonia chlamydosporia 170]OAQ72040.1 hypothetical protein VFPPC_00104 [Pochonia chlamydosporia 170]